MKWHNEMHNWTNVKICKEERCNIIHIFEECNEMHKQKGIMRCACLSNVMRNVRFNNIHESNLVMRYTRGRL